MTAVPSTDRDQAEIDEIAAALAANLQGEVRNDAYTCHLYSSDASMYAVAPLAVTFPKHAEDVAATIAVASELRVPVLPRGAGTSLAGQTVGRAVIMDFSRHMNRIVDIDAEAMTARVQPGVIQDQLNDAVRGVNLMFGPDTSTSDRATIGGMIGNNSAGSHSIQYGSTIDHVEALEVILSDAKPTTLASTPLVDGHPVIPRGDAGTDLAARLHRGVLDIVHRHAGALADFPAFWRHSGGYRIDRVMSGNGLDLHKLMVGSEGTLAVVTEATLRLVEAPRSRAIAVGHFASTLDAIAATQSALLCRPASIELMDRMILDLSRQRTEFSGLADLLVGDPAALLFVEFTGESSAAVADKVKELGRIWSNDGHGYHTLSAISPQQRTAVLKVRKASLGLLMAASVGTLRPLAFVEDTAVPTESLVPYVKAFTEILERHSMDAGFYGHCSVGCLHIRPFVDLSQPGQVRAMRQVAEEVSDLARQYGGVNSSEHGDGLARSEFNQKLFGENLYGAMREIKSLFDPAGRLNPGKIVDAPAMTENLRDAQLPVAIPVSTKLSFDRDGGMRLAADRCMNIGTCRKETAGVMCPSYMATRDEEHSTRGRANALVKALSEPDPRAALGSERLHEILDLCLECKACKSECPLGVDMAALKSETLFQRHQIHGTPLRSRLFSEIRTFNRACSALAPASSWLLNVHVIRSVMDRCIGISRHRTLPAFHRKTVLSRRPTRRRRPNTSAPTRGEIVLLTDSLTTYNEPAVGWATVELLEAAGWQVHLSGKGCCGRASISKGLLDQAQAKALSLVGLLTPFAERGVPIVGVEPSCLLTLTDEYAALLPDDDRVAIVAQQVALLPDLLTQAIDEGVLTLKDDSVVAGKRIVFHGHCHERALVGTRATRSLLERIPGADVHEVDAGCCGMAGSFGYESEHYELSMRIGRLRLLPALAKESADTLIVASGASCRQQIGHGIGRKAFHPAQLLREAVDIQ